MAYQRGADFESELQELFDTSLKEGIRTLRDIARDSDDDDVRQKAAKTLVDTWKDYNGIGQPKLLQGPGVQTNNIQVNIDGLKGVLNGFARGIRKQDPEAARLIGEATSEFSVLEAAVHDALDPAPCYEPPSHKAAGTPPARTVEAFVVPSPEEERARRQKLKETLAARGHQDILSDLEMMEAEPSPLGRDLLLPTGRDRLEDDWDDDDLSAGESSDD